MVQLLKYLSPKNPYKLSYMLQQSDYSNMSLLRWVLRKPSLTNIQQRGTLVYTGRTWMHLFVAYIGWTMPLLAVAVLLAIQQSFWWMSLVLLMPVSSLLALILVNAMVYPIIKNKFKAEIKQAEKRLSSIPATRIAIIGSYGKTTVKELLRTTLSSEKNIAATPENKNVLISHARWINSISGKEDVLIFEYGESQPGDIEKMAKFSKPDLAIITGLAPAHMEGYKTVDEIAKDFATIQQYTSQPPFINNDSRLLDTYITPNEKYDKKSIGDWAISTIAVTIDGTSFTMRTSAKKLEIKSGLIGEHLVGPLALTAVIADMLGMKKHEIEAAIAKTKPFKHRMQPYRINDAWIIDDTYNGNIEGMRAGLRLLRQLPAKRKTYVTPGLVEQGSESEKIHIELGRLIAAARLDRVYIMKNSVSTYIEKGLLKNGFDGKLTIVDNPLDFYENLELIVASGDLVLMQNDWPDGYA